MEALIASIAQMPARDLQCVAAQAARSGEPLTAMRLIKELAVRCAHDPEAIMHVCTALHVHNDSRNLYSLLNCCVDCADVFALFAEAQRAYGTRVFCNVVCNDVMNCVCVVTLYRVCVFGVDDNVVSVLHDLTMRDVNVLGDLHMLPQHGIYVFEHIRRLQALPSPTEAELAHMLLPAVQRQLQPNRWVIPADRAGALKELVEVSPPTLHPLTFKSKT